MNYNSIEIANAYYSAMAKRNVADIEKYLDETIVFIAPLANVIGKQEFVTTLHTFVSLFTQLTIRGVFGLEDQAMVVYTLEFPGSIGNVETAALLHINNGMIKKIELFYDARPFGKI